MHELKEELRRISSAKNSCVDRYGVVKPFYRYRYQELHRTYEYILKTIEWMEATHKEE